MSEDFNNKVDSIIKCSNDKLEAIIKKYSYSKPPIDYRTMVGKGTGFKSIDGKEWETYEDAVSYNETLYDILFPKVDEDSDKGMHR